MCRSLLPDPTLSTTVVRRDSTDYPAAIDSAARLFSIVGIPLAVDVAERVRPGLEQAMADRGMREVARRPGMVADLGRVDLEVPPVEVRIGRVTTAAELAGVREVQHAAFGLDPAVAEGLLHDDMLTSPGVYQFGAWLDDALVGCATMHIDDRAAGLFGIATHPDHQRRGIGTDVTRGALAAAVKLGADLAWLQSTEMGLGVYEGLGFETVADFVVWRSPHA